MFAGWGGHRLILNSISSLLFPYFYSLFFLHFSLEKERKWVDWSCLRFVTLILFALTWTTIPSLLFSLLFVYSRERERESVWCDVMNEWMNNRVISRVRPPPLLLHLPCLCPMPTNDPSPSSLLFSLLFDFTWFEQLYACSILFRCCNSIFSCR